jgi:hypothetical protein
VRASLSPQDFCFFGSPKFVAQSEALQTATSNKAARSMSALRTCCVLPHAADTMTVKRYRVKRIGALPINPKIRV